MPASPPSSERLSLRIGGMTCGTCSARVRKALLSVPGVLEAEVNLATGTARVARGAGLADTPLLVAAAVRAGYTAEPTPTARETLERRALAETAASDRWLARALVAAAGTWALLSLHGYHAGALPWASAALATSLQLFLGWPFYRGAWKALRAGAANMDVLIALGATAGYALAASSLLFEVSSVGLHFDCAPAVLGVVSLGKFLEARARRQASDAVRGLLEHLPPRALVLRAGQAVETDLNQIRRGDHLQILPHAGIPVDGRVTSGLSSVDESSITGEPIPAPKEAGDPVRAGTTNGPGTLEIVAERVGEETLLAQVAQRVEAAQASRASASRLADRIAAWLAPLALAAALAALAGWGWAGDWGRGWKAATAVLLAACPCALGLAIPAALAVGVGLAARRGVLFRDVEAMERAATVRRVWFDKTGTLTTRTPRVARIWTSEGESERTLLRLAASAERGEPHPLARALVAHALAEGVPLDAPLHLERVPGRGVTTTLPDGAVSVGSVDFLRAQGVQMLPAERVLAEARGLPTVAVARGGRLCGLIVLEEEARPEAAQALRSLREAGFSLGLLSGDSPERSQILAARLEIPTVGSGLTPEQKAQALRASGEPSAMVGDGINDAAALAEAELGIALGQGAELAQSAAAVTLLREDLRAVPWMLAAARAVRRVVRENLLWAFGYNLAVLPLALSGRLEPWGAAALMAGSDLVVLANALTLRWRVPGWKRP